MFAAAFEMPIVPVIEVPEEGDETKRDFGNKDDQIKHNQLQISLMSPTSAITRQRYKDISSKLLNLPKNWRKSPKFKDGVREYHR